MAKFDRKTVFLLFFVLAFLVAQGLAGGCSGCGGGGGGGSGGGGSVNPVDPSNPTDPLDPTDPADDDFKPGVAFYVAPGGDDAADGTKDAPLATLAGARDRVRLLKAQSGLPAGGVGVYFRGGTYAVTDTAEFGAEDSGTSASPVVYMAYPGEKPVFSGGTYIPGRFFKQAGDASAGVMCYNLFENGFSYDDLDYSKDFWRAGNLREFEHDRYWDNWYIPGRMQVFVDDEALWLARYPNKVPGTFAENPYNDYLKIPEVIESGFDPVTKQPNGRPCTFTTRETRIKNWKSYEDVVIFGMTGWEFFQSEVVASRIDPAAMTVTLAAVPTSGVTKGSRYAFANVFEELDQPGEYYIDKHTGTLYLYPPKDLASATVKISRLEKNYMIDAYETSFVRFSNLTFELTKGSVMRIRGGESCRVQGCTLKNFGTAGIRLGEGTWATRDLVDEYGRGRYEEATKAAPASQNGFDHRITGCTFLNTGWQAASVYSGNVALRERGGARFENNVVKHSGLLGSCYFSGLVANGAGITVKNNAFLFCLGQAINGNVVDTEIVYNEFCDSPCDMAEDTCAIYLNYGCLNDGVRIRYNYFHDITNRDEPGIGFDYARRAAAGYDNWQPFQDFSYNVCANVPCVGNPMGALGPMTMNNNVFVDCDYVLDYPAEFFRDHYNGETPLEIVSTTGTLPAYFNGGLYASELWKQIFPELYAYYRYMATEKKDMNELMAQFSNNIVVNFQQPRSGRSTTLPDSVPVDAKYGKVTNNYFLEADPGFASYRGRNFQLPQTVAEAYGVEWLDMSKIGVPGLARPTRISDGYTDPLWSVKTDKEIDVNFPSGEPLAIVTLWREVVPGVWQFVNDSALNIEFSSTFVVKPGGRYTAFYNGDATHYPQFPGGLTGQTPPAGVATFTVEPDRDRWDPFVFSLVPR